MSRHIRRLAYHVDAPARLCSSPIYRPSLLAQPVTGIRHATNATHTDYISSLSSVKTNAAKPGGWRPALIHSSGAVKFTVIRCGPGEEVPAHYHHACWDYFVPLSGKGVIESTHAETGERRNFDMTPDTFLAMPPMDVHRVRNAHQTEGEEDFVFLIAQSPRDQYDFVDSTKDGGATNSQV